MKSVLTMAACLLAASLMVGGCEKSRDEMRPDPDKVVSGQPGLQSRDLREMTDRMAPDLLQIPEIVRNPNRIVIVMTPVENKLVSNPGEDLSIYVARLKTLLNSSQTRDRIAFVLDPNSLAKIRQFAGAGNSDVFEQASRYPQAADSTVRPQFSLGGVFYEKHGNKTNYYLCTFQLTDLASGLQIWERSYEVSTLN